MRKISFRARLPPPPADRRAARLVSRTRSAIPPDHETTSGSPIGALERVLQRHPAIELLTAGSVAATELRAAVRAIALDARAEDPVRCERMLLALRCAWR